MEKQQVSYYQYNLQFQVQVEEQYIHAVAFAGVNFTDLLVSVLLAEEQKKKPDLASGVVDPLYSGLSQESILCREAAKDIFTEKYPGSKIGIARDRSKRNSPPGLFVDGEKKNTLLSISHHGRFCAIAAFGEK